MATPQPADLSTRKMLLEEAAEIITNSRNASYGEPNQDFTRTAELWSIAFGHNFSSDDVAKAMILLKISRLTWSPDHRDSWLDIAGYAACGYESKVIDMAKEAEITAAKKFHPSYKDNEITPNSGAPLYLKHPNQASWGMVREDD